LQLGSGAFSVVKEGFDRSNKDSFAIKIITKVKLSEEDAVALKDEISILKSLKHNNIIQLYDVYDEKQFYYLVTEKMVGGELFDRIVQKSYYNEKEARDTALVLFQAINFCHQNQIAHRDLKPENLLLLVSLIGAFVAAFSRYCLQNNESDTNIKIADFGFAKRCPKPNSLQTQCGTPGYVAPEILEGKKYDTQADMWSMGVIVYILLGGYPPFIEQNQRELFRKIRKGQYKFHNEYWGQVSDDAKDLIRVLLTTDPTKRVSSVAALENKWIGGDDKVLAGKDLGVNLSEFKKFNAKRKMKAAVRAVMATQKLSSLGVDFQKNLTSL